MHASPDVFSTKRRHQSPEWTILSHNVCFFHREVFGFQVLLDSIHPCSTWVSWWSPVLQGEAVKSSWHLIHMAFMQCGQTGRDAKLEQQSKGLTISRRHSADCGII